MRRLLVPLLVGFVALGGLVASDLSDLVAHTRQAPDSVVRTETFVTSDLGPHFQPSASVFYNLNAWVLYNFNAQTPSSGVLSAAQWWRSAPTLAVAFATIGLLVAVAFAARRRRGYTPEVGRLLGASAFVALLGGPLAVLIAALAPRWAGGDWIRSTLWPQALLWTLIGGALLAVRELLARAAELRSELDGVI